MKRGETMLVLWFVQGVTLTPQQITTIDALLGDCQKLTHHANAVLIPKEIQPSEIGRVYRQFRSILCAVQRFNRAVSTEERLTPPSELEVVRSIRLLGQNVATVARRV